MTAQPQKKVRKKVTKKTTKKPVASPEKLEPLYGEPASSFRIRAVEALLRSKGPMTTDQLVVAYGNLYQPTSKENLRRHLTVLQQRGLVSQYKNSEGDQRLKCWEAVA